MTALNLTKDQATTAITEALNGGDEDKDTDISRFQQVQEAFPENFKQSLYTAKGQTTQTTPLTM